MIPVVTKSFMVAILFLTSSRFLEFQKEQGHSEEKYVELKIEDPLSEDAEVTHSTEANQEVPAQSDVPVTSDHPPV